jgi:hypothetical protein
LSVKQDNSFLHSLSGKQDPSQQEMQQAMSCVAEALLTLGPVFVSVLDNTSCTGAGVKIKPLLLRLLVLLSTAESVASILENLMNNMQTVKTCSKKEILHIGIVQREAPVIMSSGHGYIAIKIRFLRSDDAFCHHCPTVNNDCMQTHEG